MHRLLFSLNLLLLSSIVISSIIPSSSAQSCSGYKFSNNQTFKSCTDLPVLNSFLHYSYDSSSGQLHIAYRHTQLTSRKWVAWAINPTATTMSGSQALVAYPRIDGSIKVYRSPIGDYSTELAEGDLSFDVPDLEASFGNNEMIIFATLILNRNGSSVINQVWQEGSLKGDTPNPHDSAPDTPNVKSMATLNLVNGESQSTGGGSDPKIRKRNIHGLLNTLGWGILLPIGAIIARYLKVFKSADPGWFYLHVLCQLSAYIVGVAGWGTGLELGSDSTGIQYSTHRTIGIILFCLGTLQIFALLLRPKPDHKYRLYWNIYHHLVGYIVIVLSIINIFKGFNILNPDKKWKEAYVGVIIILVVSAILLEAYTWFVVIKRRRIEKAEKINRANVFSGHVRTQQNV